MNTKNIEARTKKICKLKTQLKNTDGILTAKEVDKVDLPNALVRVNDKGEYLTSIPNAYAMPTTINLDNLEFESIQNSSINNITEDTAHNNSNFDRQTEIRLEHFAEEKVESIQ